MPLPVRELEVPGFSRLNDTLQPQADVTQPFWVYDGYLEGGAVVNRRGWKKLGSSTVVGTYTPAKYQAFEYVKTGQPKVSTFSPLVTVGTTAVEAAAYGAGLWAVGGVSGALLTSPDGVTWTSRTSQFGATTISGLAFGGGLFVAVGGGKISTSADGITWTAQTPAGSPTTLFGVGYGNGIYVVAGTDGNGYIATSPDGVTWTQRTSSFGATQVQTYVAYGAGVYVVGGASGKVASSPDGITWTQRTSSFGTDNLAGITFGGGSFVAVSNSAVKIATSTDGITWTQVASVPGTAFFEEVVYGNGMYIVTGGSNPAPVILMSTDLITWTAQDVTAFGGSDNLRGLAWDGSGKFIVTDPTAGNKVAFGQALLAGSIWVVVTDQKFYTVDSAGTLTNTLTAANLTTAGVTLGGTHAVYLTNYAGKLIVSDGTNTPWMWDGTTNGGITKLTNAPVAYGAPTVYYARLVFITAADRTIIEWCEVNSPNTGYLAGGFLNSWQLTQTASDNLTQIVGRNEGLYYGRASSIGAIRGAVTATFSTDGTHDGISRGIGMADRERAYLDFGGYLWFCDQFNRPYRMEPGGQLTPLYGQIQRQIEAANPALASSSWTVSRPFNMGEDHSLGLILAIVPAPPPAQGQVLFVFAGATPYSEATVLRYDVPSGLLIGREGWSGSAWGSMLALGYLPTYGNASLGALMGVSNSGQVCLYGVDNAGTNNYGSDDLTNSTSQPLTTTVIGPAQGYAPKGEWSFEEIDVAYETDNADANALVKVDYLTDNEHYSTVTAPQQTAVAYDAAFQIKEQRARFGINGNGSWIRVRVQITALGRVAIKSWTVKAFRTVGVLVKVA